MRVSTARSATRRKTCKSKSVIFTPHARRCVHCVFVIAGAYMRCSSRCVSNLDRVIVVIGITVDRLALAVAIVIASWIVAHLDSFGLGMRCGAKVTAHGLRSLRSVRQAKASSVC